MKAADGVQIAERWAQIYGILSANDDAMDAHFCTCIEELSRAEERERVLRKALTSLRIRFVALFDGYVRKTYVGSNGDDDLRIALMDTDAALTAAPEQPSATKEDRGE